MADLMQQQVSYWLSVLALPEYGLSSLFLVAFISATLLPLASEPAVVGLLQLNPELFWSAILVATLGNTLGGSVSYALGYGVHLGLEKIPKARSHLELRALRWLKHLGPKACFFSWLPLLGDVLCACAGWLKLPFWPSLIYMALGKFLRYLIMTWAILQGLKIWFT